MAQYKSAFPFIIVALTLLVGAWALPVMKDAGVDHTLGNVWSFWGIPNSLNVLSNLALIGVGSYGLSKQPRFRLDWQVLLGLITILISLIISGITSAYYHWTLDELSLLSMRMPIALGLLGGVSFALLSAQLNLKTWSALILYFLLQACAIGCTLYCYFVQDISFYIMSHIFPLIILLVSTVRLKQQSRAKDLLYSLLFYVLAQISALYHDAIYAYTHEYVNGYTFKHILIAIGSFFLLRFFLYLKPIEVIELAEQS